ncbi:MAG: hypothetical protein R3E90_06155 [Marinicella sp.]
MANTSDAPCGRFFCGMFRHWSMVDSNSLEYLPAWVWLRGLSGSGSSSKMALDLSGLSMGGLPAISS